MQFGRARVVVAFDALGVAAVSLGSGLRGPSPRALVSCPLEPGVLLPSITERNIARPAELRESLVALLARLGARRGRGVDVVVPAGVSRPLLIETAARRPGPELLHTHLTPALPFPLREAVTGSMRVAPGWHLAAGIRRACVEEYESVISSAGLTPRRVELAPFLALDGLLRKPLPQHAVDVVLGDRAVSLAVWGAAGPVAFRTRLRQGDDDEALIWEEVERITGSASGPFGGARVTGRGARALVRHAVARGRRAALAWELSTGTAGPDASELAWLGGVLA